MNGGDNDKKSFWNTLPGILTGIAAIITAIGGLLVILHSMGVFDGEEPDELQVELPKIEQFDSDPAKIDTGETSQLRWVVSGATRATIEPGIGSVALTGTRHVSPSETTTYTLIAENEAGRVDATVELVVEPEEKVPTIEYFESDPAGISVGQSTTLKWAVSGATRATIEPGIGSVALTGTRRISPSETTTYTLIAENGAGRVDVTVTVEVVQPETHSTGLLTIPQTWTVDLDEGVVGAGEDADIWFEALTATERYVTPRNRAKIAKVGTRSVGSVGCMATSLSSSKIDINDLPEGTYVCVLTNEGRFSQFRVNAPVGPSPGTLSVGYTTWEKVQ